MRRGDVDGVDVRVREQRVVTPADTVDTAPAGERLGVLHPARRHGDGRGVPRMHDVRGKRVGDVAGTDDAQRILSIVGYWPRAPQKR